MALNPDISVNYSKVLSPRLFNSVMQVSTQDKPVDVAWSSAMDLQIKLVNDGYATEYRSGETGRVPSWAKWKDSAYGITAEPVVFIYNKRLLPDDLVPRDRAALLRLLTERPELLAGKIASYDPERSGTGLLFITQDVRVTTQTWNLVSAMGRAKVELHSSSARMIERVASGELLFAYNVLGSYALERAKHSPDIGIIWPSDYTLLMTRIALIPRSAPHPEAAKRFLDYLLSPAGQELVASHSLGSVQGDAQSSRAGAAMGDYIIKPIAVTIDLLTYLDQAKRGRFLKQWRLALQGQSPPASAP